MDFIMRNDVIIAGSVLISLALISALVVGVRRLASWVVDKQEEAERARIEQKRCDRQKMQSRNRLTSD